MRITQDNLDCRNFYAFNPSFDVKCNPEDIEAVGPELVGSVSNISNISKAAGVSSKVKAAETEKSPSVVAYKSTDMPVNKVAAASNILDTSTSKTAGMSKVSDTSTSKTAGISKVSDTSTSKTAGISKVSDTSTSKTAGVSKVSDTSTSKTAGMSKVSDTSTVKSATAPAYDYKKMMPFGSNSTNSQVQSMTNPSAKRSKRVNNGWG